MKAGSGGPRAASERLGLLDWLRRWFGGGPAVPQASNRVRRVPAAHAPAAMPGALGHVHAVDPERTVASPPGFEAYAEALGITFQAPLPLTEAELAEVVRLVAAVEDHFAAERDNLEMLPTSSLRILNLVARTDVEFSELVSAASQDPAISAAVLRVANSVAVAGAGREVRTVREATDRLGVTEVGRVAGAVAARVLFSSRAKAEQAMFSKRRSELHWQAVTCAAGCAYFAMQAEYGRSDLAYLGGILHDVGKSVALSSLSALTLAGRVTRDIGPAVLDAVLERVHTQIGTESLRHWSIPGYLVTLCATHHDASVPFSPDSAEIHLVRVISGLLALWVAPDPGPVPALLQSLQTMQVQPRALRALDAHLRGLSQQIEQVLGLGAGGAANPRSRSKTTA